MFVFKVGAILLLTTIYDVSCQTCLPGWMSRTGDRSCYLFVTRQRAMTWDDAKSACVGMKGTLALINDTTQMRWLQTQTAKLIQSDPTTSEWWVGLKKMSGNSWTWTDGSLINTALGLWLPNQPNNAVNPGCAKLAQGNSIGLSADSCAQEKGYICERAIDAPAYCDSDNGWESHHGNCYKFFDYRKQWADAKVDCENQGSVLARPINDQEQRTVYDIAVNFKRDSWIGLHSVVQGGSNQWQWANGTGLATNSYWKSQTRFLSGMENNTCIVEHPGNGAIGGWASKACYEERQYICQKPEAQCAPGWKAFGTMCYLFDSRFSLSWDGTKSYCESLGGMMLEITSQDIQNFVLPYLQELRQYSMSYLWIGLTDGTSTTYKWNSGAPLVYKNWYRTPPSSTYKHCAYIYTSNSKGQWYYSSYCTQLRGVACQIPSTVGVRTVTTPRPTYRCERGWYIYNSHTDDPCYKFNYTSLLNWQDARTACQNAGGDLAVITSATLQSWVNRYIRGTMWVGLSDAAQENTFTWVDNSPASYTNWDGHDVSKLNTDNKDCVAELYDPGRRGTWKPMDCSETNGFICQKKPSNAPSVTPGTGTTPIPWSVNCGPFWEELTSSGFCYQFHEEQKTYADAQNFCAQRGGNLASIATIAEQNYIAGRIRTMKSTALWLGANDMSVEGGWMWQDSSPFTYINWTPGEPNNDEDNEDCVTIFTNKATWNDFNCNTKNGFICKKKSRVTPATSPTNPRPTAPAGMFLGCPFGWLSFNNKCYLIKKEVKSWSQARSVCKNNGGDLTSITSLAEQDFLYSQARSVVGPLWIGLSSTRYPRFYEWIDGLKTTFTHWSRDEPNNQIGGNEKCVTFNGLGAGYWSDAVCNLPNIAGYICKKNPTAMAVTKPQDYKAGCPANGVGYYSNCYLFYEDKKSFDDAEAFCVQQGGHLMAVLDRFIQAFLTSELSQHNGMYWIGLKTYTTGYYYYYWTNKMRVRYTNFDQYHTGREVASCISVNTQRPAGLWHNSGCNVLRPFICETSRQGYSKPPPGQQTTVSNRCPSYYTEYFGQCYRLISTSYSYRKNWFEARDYCRLYGGDLVSIQNKTMADALKRYVFRYSRYSYWIGLSNSTAGNGYAWSDGSGFSYSQWGSGEPDNRNQQEDCVEWDMPSNSWRDANCYVGKSYACQIAKGSVIVRPTIPRVTTVKPPVTCGDTRYARYWRYYQGACYFFSYYSRTWYQARDYCRNTVKGDLLSVHDAAEANFVSSELSKRSSSVSWIGLNELGLNGYTWSDGQPLQFKYWDKNEPNDAFGGQRCVVASSTTGFWGDENCGQIYPFICKQRVGGSTQKTPTTTKPLPGNCRAGWTNFGNKCYRIFDSYLTFNDSSKACKRNGKGFELVSISSEDEQAFVYSMLNGKSGVDSYWIGLNQMQRLRSFVWLDNSPVYFTNWDYREPNGSSYYSTRQELCVEIRTYGSSAGKWADVKCYLRKGYICQGYKEANQPVPKATTPPSWCKAAGYSVYGSSCYKLLTKLMTWDTASAACKKDGGHLISIGDSFEQAHARVMTYGQGMSFWTGMTDRKLKGVYRWSDGWPVLYTNWGRGEPSRKAGEGCVALVANATWNDTTCSFKYGAICEISHGSPPPHTSMVPGFCSNSTWTSHGRYCYYLSSRGYSSWPESQFYCKKMGMRLVTIHTAEEQGFILKLIASQTTRTSYYFWVGLANARSNGFEWSDFAQVSYTNWASNEPSNGRYRNAEECVQIHPTTGQWYDTYCTTRRPYICQADMVFPTQPGSVTTPQGVTQKGPNTNKPPVTQAPGQSTKSPGHSTKSPGRQTDKQPQTPRGGLSGGGVAGIVIGVLIALVLVALGLIYARRQGFINVGPDVFPKGSFENALYKKNADDVDIQ